MAPIVHVIDPDYDTVLILKNASTKFASWPSEDEPSIAAPTTPFNTYQKKRKALKAYKAELTAVPSRTTDATTSVSSTAPEEKEVHYHVSSRHLQLASPWFKRAMTKDGWAESKLINGHHQVLAHDWDEQAFRTLLNMLHLRNKQVPRTVSLEMLAKTAVLVDYYECGEAIELFTATWIGYVQETEIPSTYCRDLILWIWVAWVFDLSQQFEDATAAVIKESNEAMETLELPIPNSVSSEVDLRRYQALESVIGGLHGLLDQYRSNSYVCKHNSTLSFQCGSFLLGALTKELGGWSLLSPRPEIPFQELVFSDICAKVENARSPHWCCTYSRGYGVHDGQHACNLTQNVKEIVSKAKSGVVGLSLSNMRSSGSDVGAQSASQLGLCFA
ncbi:hypothetical protein EKO04_008405 [Ascochyta lentis]|uniref:BTB domain-containing protein n=1 Tax=Ascochyta lentis TaxID=205686 RepID=A0A8H7IYH8_9PLEO|nr:hypothetical protein EKO04_008405 [Ascochyta lentis]